MKRMVFNIYKAEIKQLTKMEVKVFVSILD